MTISEELARLKARELSDKHGCAQYVFRQGDSYKIIDSYPDSGHKLMRAFGIEHVCTVATNGWTPGTKITDWW